MSLTIHVRGVPDRAPATLAFDSPRLVIGRSSGADLRLPDASVSGRHASIRQRGSDYIVLDEGSTNGTFVGPVKLPPQAPRVLRSGDEVRIGRFVLEVRIDALPATGNTQSLTRELAMALMARALDDEGQTALPRVRAVAGPGVGALLELTETEHPYTVGRGQDVDMRLQDPDASRRHVELIRRGSRVVVRDLGSKNGSLLGSRELPAGVETPWSPGTALRLANTDLQLDDPVADALRANEHRADELLSEEEDTALDEEPAAADASAAAGDAPAAEVGARPVAESPAPARPSHKKSRPTSGRWNTTDTAILLVSLLVIALSLFGLTWVMRSR